MPCFQGLFRPLGKRRIHIHMLNQSSPLGCFKQLVQMVQLG
jgi:hypothetical protein